MDLHFDCVGGASGDMLLAALCELHDAPDLLLSVPERLGLSDVRVQCDRTLRHHLSALRVSVVAPEREGHRHLPDVLNVLSAARLPDIVKDRAADVFTRLARAEARVHGISVNQVHFHEVGADDALVDIAGVCLLLAELGPDRVTAGPLPLSRGVVRASHGEIPLPAPAVLELLAGWPVEWIEEEGERVTPTGAALLVTLAQCALPSRGGVVKTGCGAGAADPRSRANIVRALLIRTDSAPVGLEPVTELVCAIDDSTGEDLAFALEILLGDGALDVYYAPRLMKKGRPGWELGVLCHAADADRLAGRVLQHTSSAGVRRRDVARYTLPRSVRSVDTRYGTIRMKLFTLPDRSIRPAPEFDDCRKAALEHGVSTAQVRQEALNRWCDSERTAG
jgi:pyridinium-3,5-bisthiocarboxylic acid mononucleotide nickel chelatase